MVNEIEKDLKNIPNLPGYDIPDVVKSLYSNQSIYPSADGTLDPVKINKWNFPPHNSSKSNYTKEIKMLIPEGFRYPLAIDTTREARLCFGSSHKNCDNEYKVKIRSMITKLPGFYFSGYRGVANFMPTQVVSELDYIQLLEDFFAIYPDSR